MAEYRYCVPGLVGWHNSRHEAIGKAAVKARDPTEGSFEGPPHPGPFEYPEEMDDKQLRENIIQATAHVYVSHPTDEVVMPI